MKLNKEISAWFPVPDDPDKTEFCFKLLNPGEVSQVQDISFEISFDFTEDERGRRIGKTSIARGREKEVFLATKGWKNLLDENGNEVKFSDATKLEPLRKVEGFYDFFAECQKKLLKIKEDQEKN
jgi:hypothetical protein